MNTRHEFCGKNEENYLPNLSGPSNGQQNRFLKYSKVAVTSSSDTIKLNSMEYDIGYNSEDVSSDIQIKSELSENDLMEIRTVPSNFKYDLNKNIKQDAGNNNPQNEIPLFEYANCKELDISETSFTRDQLNVEECLLDLDNYLEKIDSNTLQYDESAFKISSTLNHFADDIIRPQFKRGVQLRNTISCALKEQKNGM